MIEPPRWPLLGRHVLVTGASGGIGAAIARRLAADGAVLTLAGRQYGPPQELADSLPSSAIALTICGDVTDSAAVNAMFRSAHDAAGPIDILVNNAGQATSAPLVGTTDILWQQMLAVNLNGAFYACRAALPDMLDKRWGRIINVASTAGQRGYAYVSAYAVAKHALVGLSKSLALEVAAKGITVNCVCPGYTETELLAASISSVMVKTGRNSEEVLAEFTQHNPQGRLVQPEEVADAIGWLCSPGASAVNGQAISVSGGEVM